MGQHVVDAWWQILLWPREWHWSATHQSCWLHPHHLLLNFSGVCLQGKLECNQLYSCEVRAVQWSWSDDWHVLSIRTECRARSDALVGWSPWHSRMSGKSILCFRNCGWGVQLVDHAHVPVGIIMQEWIPVCDQYRIPVCMLHVEITCH
jgi:hypothetical protein